MAFIRVVCPHGHQFRGKQKLAGKVVLCPVCDRRFQIPLDAPVEISDDDVLGFVGKPKAQPQRERVKAPETKPVTNVPTPAGAPPRVRNCPHCEREIHVAHHICPHCRTYVAGLKDF